MVPPAQAVLKWLNRSACGVIESTVAFDGNQIVHLDCQRPRELSHEERVLLFRYCFGHAVAQCVACECNFQRHQLATDLRAHRTHLRPYCRVDLTENVRADLYGCDNAQT